MSCPVSAPILLEGWVQNAPDVVISGLDLDAGAVDPGHAYIALDHPDAARHAGEAEARGAHVVIHDTNVKLQPLDVPSVAVAGLERRIPELAARFYHHPAEQLKVAGVAGNSGRTSVAHFIAQSWQRAGGGAGLIGSPGIGPFNALKPADEAICEPVMLQRTLSACIDEGVEMVAMEVMPQSLERGWMDEIAFDVAVFTGLDPAYRGQPCSADADEDALRRLFTGCHPCFAVINHDEAAGKTLTRLIDNGTQVLTYGTNGATELQGSILAMDSAGMTVSIAGPWGGGEIRTGLLGRRNLPNLLAAAGALALVGMPWNRVMHQVEIMSAAPGRLNCVSGERGQPAAVLDRARTPEALEDVLRALRSHLHGRLYCVLSATGEGSQELNQLAELHADRVIQVSAGTRNEAVRQVIAESGAGDIVLITGDWREGSLQMGEATVRDLLEEAA